jgi:CheY-like chemotaxis protein
MDDLLVIEDRDEDVELLRIACGLSGFPAIAGRIDVLSDGKAVVDRIQAMAAERQPLPSLILLDLNLPLVSGVDLLRMLRQRWDQQRLPIFILTTSADPQMRQRCLDLGANRFYTKSNTLAGYLPLLQEIDAVLT